MKYDMSDWSYEMLFGTSPGASRMQCVTAAVISKPYLVLLTLRQDILTKVDVQKSAIFILADRSTPALQALSTQIRTFSTRHRINEVFLRSHSENGKYAGHPLNFKMEATAQLSGLSLTFVHTERVRAWMRDGGRPLPDRSMFKSVQGLALLQKKAAETARFVIECNGSDRHFSQGTETDG